MADEQNQNQNLNPDLAGYPSVEHLVAAYRASGDEGKKQRDRADVAERRFAEQAAQGYGYAANQRPDIPQRSPDPYANLEGIGIPREDFRAAVRAEAQGMIAEAFQPIAQGFQARNELLGQYPDYQKFEADVASYVNADPDLSQRYQRMFKSDPAAAMDYAFLKFGDSRRRQHPGSNNGVQGQQMTEAQIPSSRTGDARHQNTQGEQTRELFERFQKTGNSQDSLAFAKARMKSVITDEFLNQ